GDLAVRDAEQIFQASGGIPVLSQGKFAARRAQTVDHLNGDDIGRWYRLLPLRDMTSDDRVEPDIVPQPACQPDITEAAPVAPAHRVQTNADDVGIGRQRNAVILGKKSKLFGIALPIVKGDSSLPPTLLILIQFPQMGNDLLSWPDVCADTLDERVVDVLLAILCSAVATKKHHLLLVPDKMPRRRPANQ